jgi:hypothetical protein
VEENKFIFSNKFSYRLLRHLAFWAIFLFHYDLQNSLIGGYHEAVHVRPFHELAEYDLFFVPSFLLSSYFFMYVVIPVFLFQRRIPGFILSFSVLILLNAVAACFTGILYIHEVLRVPYGEINFDMNRYNIIVNGLWIPIIVMGLTGGIRLTKKWILQEKANGVLMKQKISRELKLLKTQVHPRFLFHSLNSLEDKLRKRQPDSPGFILKLADILSYILYESEAEYVLLEKEIDVIRLYMDLQNCNYPESLLTRLNISTEGADLYVVPLILLSFLEAGFEYLTMKEHSNKSMTVSIKTSEESLLFNLSCTEEDGQEDNRSHMPSLSDIQRRLENLYPDKHQLLLKSNNKELQIALQLNLIISSAFPVPSSETLNLSREYA